MTYLLQKEAETSDIFGESKFILYFLLSKGTILNCFSPAGKATVWHGAGQLAVVGCWVCPNYLWRTWSLCFLQMWLQQTEFCHEVPDGTEAISSATQNNIICNTELCTLQLNKEILCVSSGPSESGHDLVIWTTHKLSWNSFLRLSLSSHSVLSLLESFVSGYDRIHPRKTVVNHDTLFYSGFSFTVDEFISANIILDGERYD